MARTESKTFTCHPSEEREWIDTMQKFHWSLLGSQEVKTVDSHLQKGGWGDDSIYSVTKTEHYIKLSFSRELDTPNLKEIKSLEDAYFGLPSPYYPKLFPIHIGLWGVLTLCYGLGIPIWFLYFFLSYMPKTGKAKRITQSNAQERRKIMSEVAKFD